jgi:hypothetical protein
MMMHTGWLSHPFYVAQLTGRVAQFDRADGAHRAISTVSVATGISYYLGVFLLQG